LGDPRKTSDTNDFETPASSATVRMVAGRPGSLVAIDPPFVSDPPTVDE
jgi:hypothetical protein